jgi:hypothetical protein
LLKERRRQSSPTPSKGVQAIIGSGRAADERIFKPLTLVTARNSVAYRLARNNGKALQGALRRLRTPACASRRRLFRLISHIPPRAMRELSKTCALELAREQKCGPM